MKILVILIALVLVVVGVWFVMAEIIPGFPGSDEDTYVPTITMTISAKSNGIPYDVDLGMDVDSPSFLDYFFSASLDPGFPSGDGRLALYLYQADDVTDRKGEEVFHSLWMVGNLYDVEGSGVQESTWEVTCPGIKTETDPELGGIYLNAYVYYNGKQIGYNRWAVNPELMTAVEE